MRIEPIRSDMVSQQREINRRPADELGFFLVASNRELLNHVADLMNRQGAIGVLDSSGRVHYVIDARKGSPFAAKKIMATAGALVSDRQLDIRNTEIRVRHAVGQVLAKYVWNTLLRGYRLLESILRMAATDVSLLNPISKRLYPEIAERYKLKSHQVERNVRYLLDNLAMQERCSNEAQGAKLLASGETNLPVGRTITRLTEQGRDYLEQMEDKDIGNMTDDGMYLQ